MARMFPDPLPPEVANDPMRAGERRVFDALRNGLSDEWTVFGNVSWARQRPGGGLLQGEADVVVVHPGLGIAVLEVKGGRVQRDGTTGQWQSTDRAGRAHEIKNPFDQALRNRRNLMALLTEGADMPRSVTIATGVVLPDSRRPAGAIAPDAPQEMALFAEDLAGVEARIRTLIALQGNDGGGGGPGARGVEEIRGILSPVVDLAIPLVHRLGEDEDVLIRLTEDQRRAFELLSRLRRVAVAGGAGTGKTVLAVEKARQLANEGARVLLACFNIPLAQDLARRCADLTGETRGRGQRAHGGHGDAPAEAPRLVVSNFHNLCTDWGRRAGTLPDVREADRDTAYYDGTLPDALVAALDRIPDRFDAIVVDEGQDFRDEWWDILELATADPGNGIFYVFYDDNQRIYRDHLRLPAGMAPVPLSRNVRNTRAIHDLAARMYEGAAFVCEGPAGQPVEWVEADGPAAMERAVGGLLHRLIRDEGVAPGDIAVLSAHAATSHLGTGGRIGAFPCVPVANARADAVIKDTIHKFKGLERPAVILVELDDVADRSQLLYVGVTRARVYLAVVGAPATLAAMRGEDMR